MVAFECLQTRCDPPGLLRRPPCVASLKGCDEANQLAFPFGAGTGP